jgi:hypothetical protein
MVQFSRGARGVPNLAVPGVTLFMQGNVDNAVYLVEWLRAGTRGGGGGTVSGQMTGRGRAGEPGVGACDAANWEWARRQGRGWGDGDRVMHRCGVGDPVGYGRGHGHGVEDGAMGWN